MRPRSEAAEGQRPRVYVIGTGGSISCVGESRIDLIDYSYGDQHDDIQRMMLTY